MKVRLLYAPERSTGLIRVAALDEKKKPPKTLVMIKSSTKTSERIKIQGSSKFTKQASKVQRKPFETLLTYLKTFGCWVP